MSKKKDKSEPLSIYDAVKAIDAYNEANGTHYSYGNCPVSPEKIVKEMEKNK